MEYQPKRSTARWLEGAPRPVLAVYDAGGEGDRYTVLYGAPLWEPRPHSRHVPARAMDVYGNGFYIEVDASARGGLGRKIKYSELPAECKRWVEFDCKPEKTEEKKP